MLIPWNAILLGIVEGITEFIPVSSTGHLLIVEQWLGARSDLFNVAIQSGAILAVTLVYRRRLWLLLIGLKQRDNRSYVGKLLHAHAALHAAPLGTMVLAGGVAGLAAWLSTWFLMRYFRRHEQAALGPFAWYCIGFGALALLLLGA